MRFNSRKSYRVFTALALMSLCMSAARADFEFDDDDGYAIPIARNTKWETECGSCHVPYPPDMLPANSWLALMSRLDRHFGSDASIDPVSRQEIASFLVKFSGHRAGDPIAKPLLRITETRWFRSQHREVDSRLWGSAKVKSAANCAACHAQAGNGSFNEHEVSMSY